jgi:hypothetical protein
MTEIEYLEMVTESIAIRTKRIEDKMGVLLQAADILEQHIYIRKVLEKLENRTNTPISAEIKEAFKREIHELTLARRVIMKYRDVPLP